MEQLVHDLVLIWVAGAVSGRVACYAIILAQLITSFTFDRQYTKIVLALLWNEYSVS